MKKIISLLSLVLVFGLSIVGIQANETDLDLEDLYVYDEIEEGVYGYDKNQPVYYFNGSDEVVKVPKTFN